jgi:hypothetical protein
MDADVVDDKPGICPICKMALQPVRIETAWSCPFHTAVMKDEFGKCEFDQRELVQVTVNHFWVCSDPGILYAEPGNCSRTHRRKERKVVRAHGDHNPRHGGQFFMAADQWHHVEGTYQIGHVFRLYLYDNYSNPLDGKDITGRVFTREDGSREVDAIPLRLSRSGTALEARISGQPLPRSVTARVKFNPRAPDQRFDFTFEALTDDPSPDSSEKAARTAEIPPVSMKGPAVTRRAPEVRAPIQGGDGAVPNAMGRLMPAAPSIRHMAPEVPKDTTQVFTLLDIRTQEVRTLIDQGNFGSVYVPTMIAKDLALALADRANEFPRERRERIFDAVRNVVRAAWSLDRFGDFGNREQLVHAHDAFTEAIASVKAAYEGR